MKLRPRFRILSAACVLCGWTVVAAAQGAGATARLEALDAALSSRSVWRADYEQEYLPVGMTAGETAAGTVWLAWPDRALFRTGDPPVRLMGLLGRTVRLVDLDDRTCDEHELGDAEWERVPLAAVLDPQGARDHFDVTETGAAGVVLVPKEAGGVDRVEVVLGDDDLPRTVTIRDPQGAVNTLRFSRWTPSASPPDGAWLPDRPEGVECTTDRGPMD